MPYIFAGSLPITGRLYGDPTGRYLATSINDNQYMLDVYDYGLNTIHD